MPHDCKIEQKPNVIGKASSQEQHAPQLFQSVASFTCMDLILMASDGGSLDGRALRRLCEPILLVESFSFAFQHCAPSRMIKPEVHRQRPQTAKDRFIKFVYKLALVSAFAPGGATVTSMAIFENSRGILYVLASNYASPEQKEEMTAHVKSLLAMIASTNNQQDLRGQKRNVLRKILLFNKIRIRAYLGMIVTCVNACQMEGIRSTLKN